MIRLVCPQARRNWIRLPGPPEGRRAEVRGVGRVVRVDLGSDNKIGVAVKFDRIDLSAEELESIT